MATKRFLGDSLAVAQVDTFTPANVEVDDVFTVTMGGQSISFTATAATVANVTAGLVALLNASTIPEFAEVTWSDETTHIQGTADTAGKPFTATSSATDGGGTDTQTFVQATTTNSSGPNHWDDASNWSDGSVPASSDTVILDIGDVDILYGLDQSAVTLTKLVIYQTFTGKIGLPVNNTDGNQYAEYRDQYLKIGSTTTEIGRGDGAGSKRIKLDNSNIQTSLTVFNSGSRIESGIPAILWKGTHASNVVNLIRGDMGAAILSGETATIATFRISYDKNQGGDAKYRGGSGVTMTTVKQSGGVAEIESDTTLIDSTGGSVRLMGSSTHAQINADGGEVVYISDGTLTQGRVGRGGVLDCSRDLRPRTFTDLELSEGATYLDPFKTVTHTNAIDLYRTGIERLTRLELGSHYTIQRGSI